MNSQMNDDEVAIYEQALRDLKRELRDCEARRENDIRACEQIVLYRTDLDRSGMAKMIAAFLDE